MAPGKDKNIAVPDRPALLAQHNWLLSVCAIPSEGDKGPDQCGVGTSFYASAYTGLALVGMVDCNPNYTLYNVFYHFIVNTANHHRKAVVYPSVWYPTFALCAAHRSHHCVFCGMA